MTYDVQPASGRFFGATFAFPVRVYYEDTDAGGIVYYANYLRFAERARTEFIRALGCSQQQALEAEDKCGFTVRSCTVDYKLPAILDDALVVTCEMREAKGASAIMYQEIYRGETLLATVEVKVAYVDLGRKRPVRIPADLLNKLSCLQAVPGA